MVSLNFPSLQILGKTHARIFPISRFLVNPLKKKIVISPEPVMTLTWNLRPVTKLDNKRKRPSKGINDDVMSKNCDVIVFFLIYNQFGAIQKPDSGPAVCKTYIFINNNFLSSKNWKQNWKESNTALTILLWVKVLFLLIKLIFGKKMVKSAKLSRSWYFWNYVCVSVIACQIWSF